MKSTLTECKVSPTKQLALSFALVCSAACAQEPVVAVTTPAPLLKLQVVIGSSSVSAAAALDDAKSKVAAAIPHGRVLASQDDKCDFVDKVDHFGEAKWQCMYIIRTEAKQPPARALWVAEPPRSHVLQTCIKWSIQLSASQAYALLREDETAKTVDTTFEINRGNELLFSQKGLAPTRDTGYGLEAKCFIITEGQMVLSSGAFVSEHSARLLRIPVLVIQSKPGLVGTVFRLQPTFPADQ